MANGPAKVTGVFIINVTITVVVFCVVYGVMSRNIQISVSFSSNT